MSRVDARLMEMQFLARLEREGKIIVEGVDAEGPPLNSRERHMMIALFQDEHVTGLYSVPSANEGVFTHTARMTTMATVHEQLQRLVFGDRPVELYISHKGRVRLSELEQQLKTGRDRDPTGLCLARRHLMTDLTIAVLSASAETPLSVAFLDMNGLKAINDAHGHRAGDDAIRAYLEAVVATFGEHGEAYRGEGGDEVVVILPGAADERAGKLLDTFMRQLGKDVLTLGDTKVEVHLTASGGSASTTNPSEDAMALYERADTVQYRAKAESKKHDPRVSAFAVGEGEAATYAPG